MKHGRGAWGAMGIRSKEPGLCGVGDVSELTHEGYDRWTGGEKTVKPEGRKSLQAIHPGHSLL